MATSTTWPPVIGGIVVRARPYRIVMVARVFRIDGDQRNGAQIGAAARIDRLGRLGFVDHRFGKFGRECRGREWRSG